MMAGEGIGLRPRMREQGLEICVGRGRQGLHPQYK